MADRRGRAPPRVEPRALSWPGARGDSAPSWTTPRWSTEAFLARELSAPVGNAVRIVDAVLPTTPVPAAAGGEAEWLVTTLTLLEQMARTDNLMACIRGPAQTRGRNAGIARSIAGALRGTEAAHAERLMLEDAVTWSLRLALGSCVPSDTGTRSRTAR